MPNANRSTSCPVDPPPGVVVFAHVPPPHHGQSYAVELLLKHLRRDPADPGRRLRIFHVDARLSDDIDAIGRFQPRKLLRLARYAIHAIACRIRYGARVLYYVPAAPMRSAVYRDWIFLALCRPFFRHFLLHWEAAGLAEWLESSARPWERALTHALMDGHASSVVLAEFGRRDATAFRARHVRVVPNGLPDPCPDSAARIEPLRRRREQDRLNAVARASSDLVIFKVLYLSLCIPEKGLFDAVEATAIANAEFARQGLSVRIELNVAGKFWREEDRERFDSRCRAPDLQLTALRPDTTRACAVVYRGFVANDEKTRLFEDSDAFVFPSYYAAESFGLALAEAMAFGLPCIATRWRHIPEMLPPNYPHLVEPKSPAEIARSMITLATSSASETLREHYQSRYTDVAYAEGLRDAMLALTRI